MTTATRFVVVCCAALSAGATAVAQVLAAPHPHPPLAELVKEYKRFGLPFPPADAQLVRIVTNFTLWNPDPDPGADRFALAYRVPPAERGARTRYLTVGYRGVGLEAIEYVEPTAVEAIEPTPDALRKIYLGDGRSSLSLAAQFKDRGWDDLAAALYSRARESLAEDEDFSSVMDEVRVIAWIDWHGPLTEPGADRREALRRLTALAAEDERFRTPDARELIRRLELTVAPRRSKPGTVEALIDDLTEYWDDPYAFPSKPAEPASYWALAELGFDAVPALIEHLGDDRLTRATALGSRYGTSHRLTVGHLCSRLLFYLSARTIGGRYSEPGGDRLDPAEARKWFEGAKKVGEEKWLLFHALPPFVGKAISYRPDRPVFVGKGIVDHAGRPEPHIVRVIGAKYPGRLPAVYRTMLKHSVGGGLFDDYVVEVVASRLPREQKIALLEEGAASDSCDHWVPALEGLARLDRAAMRIHLRAALLRVWLGAWLGGPEPSPGRRLVRLIDAADDRECWDALASVARVRGVGFRLDVIRAIRPDVPPDRPDPQRLERVRFLVPFLDDRADYDYEDGTRVEVRDLAATQLAGLLGFCVRRDVDRYRPVYESDRGPLSYLFIRAAVWQAAVRELLGKE